MLRPSRPMIRPFMSSLGSVNTATVDSAVCSEATRWIAMVTIFRARSSPSSRACCSISRTWAIAERFASSTTWPTGRRAPRARSSRRSAPAGRDAARPRSRGAARTTASRLVALVQLGLADVELLASGRGPRLRRPGSAAPAGRSRRGAPSRRPRRRAGSGPPRPSPPRRPCAGSGRPPARPRPSAGRPPRAALGSLLDRAGVGRGHGGADEEPGDDADREGGDADDDRGHGSSLWTQGEDRSGPGVTWRAVRETERDASSGGPRAPRGVCGSRFVGRSLTVLDIFV